MGVEVHVKIEIVVVVVMHNHCFGRKNCLVVHGIRGGVEAIQVEAIDVRAVVAASHTIGIENGNNLEDKTIA